MYSCIHHRPPSLSIIPLYPDYFITHLAYIVICIWVPYLWTQTKDQIQTISVTMSDVKDQIFDGAVKTNPVNNPTHQVRPGELLTYIKRRIFHMEPT